jgi:hypothetical protein
VCSAGPADAGPAEPEQGAQVVVVVGATAQPGPGSYGSEPGCAFVETVVMAADRRHGAGSVRHLGMSVSGMLLSAVSRSRAVQRCVVALSVALAGSGCGDAQVVSDRGLAVAQLDAACAEVRGALERVGAGGAEIEVSLDSSKDAFGAADGGAFTISLYALVDGARQEEVREVVTGWESDGARAAEPTRVESDASIWVGERAEGDGTFRLTAAWSTPGGVAPESGRTWFGAEVSPPMTPEVADALRGEFRGGCP